MRRFRRFTWLLVPGLLLTACGEEESPEPASASAAQLPSNLCESIPQNVVERWALEGVSHETVRADASNVATCEMSGTYEEEAVELSLVFTTFAGDSSADARGAAEAELAEQCDQLDTEAVGEGFTQDENECTWSPPLALQPGPTTVVNVARSIPARGVVRVEMSHGGLGYQLLPAEVIGISTALTTTDPADL